MKVRSFLETGIFIVGKIKVMGMLVKDIMQCFPNETGELIHVVEFIIYNTPGPHVAPTMCSGGNRVGAIA